MKIASGDSYEMHQSWKKDGFEISTDPGKIDYAVLRQFLTNSYWSPGIPPETVQRAVRNSLCFGIYHGNRQVGFARAITDLATFAYIADVFVIETYRGRGLSKWLMACIKSHPDLQRLRRWALITRDAHSLYHQFGFTQLANPEGWMEIHHPDVYQKASHETR